MIYAFNKLISNNYEFPRQLHHPRSHDIRINSTHIDIESILYEYIDRGKTPEEIEQQLYTITLK